METRVETWPASVLENSAPASECPRSDVWGLELRWLLWAACSSLRGLRGSPRVRDAVGSESLPLPGSPSLGHGGSSGGLPGNHSNFPAHSGWVGTQVHLLSWFQGSGKKSTGSRWGCSFRSTVLLSRDQTCPSISSPASDVFSQLLSGTRKDQAC